jgi:hypothetical protein
MFFLSFHFFERAVFVSALSPAALARAEARDFEAISVAREANDIARDANRVASRAERWAMYAAIAAVIALIISIARSSA